MRGSPRALVAAGASGARPRCRSSGSARRACPQVPPHGHGQRVRESAANVALCLCFRYALNDEPLDVTIPAWALPHRPAHCTPDLRCADNRLGPEHAAPFPVQKCFIYNC